MVSSRFSWIGFASLTVTTACGLFGDYTTAKGGGGSGGQGTGAAGLSGGAGGNGTGGSPACPALQCEGACASSEECGTLQGETALGNALCAEASTETNATGVTISLEDYRLRAFLHGATPKLVGTKRVAAQGALTAFISDLPLPDVPFANAIFQVDTMPGQAHATGFVEPYPSEPDGWLIGAGNGSLFGVQNSPNYRAFALHVNMPFTNGADVDVATPYVLEAEHSRIIAATQTWAGGVSRNDTLNALVLHTSDLGTVNGLAGDPRLSMVRFPDHGAPVTSNDDLRIKQLDVLPGCTEFTNWDPTSGSVLAGAAAENSSKKAFFATGYCNKPRIVSWEGGDTFSEIVPDGDYTDVTFAGLHAFSPGGAANRLIAAGTFSGTFGFDVTELVGSAGNDQSHDAFVAVFDPNLNLTQFAHLGGVGDVRIQSMDVNTNGDEVTLFVGGWVKGDVSWGCLNPAVSADVRQAFVARISLGPNAAGPVVPLFFQVFGDGANDSEIDVVAYTGGNLWAGGHAVWGNIKPFPTTQPNNKLDLTGGGTFALRLNVDLVAAPH